MELIIECPVCQRPLTVDAIFDEGEDDTGESGPVFDERDTSVADWHGHEACERALIDLNAGWWDIVLAALPQAYRDTQPRIGQLPLLIV